MTAELRDLFSTTQRGALSGWGGCRARDGANRCALGVSRWDEVQRAGEGRRGCTGGGRGTARRTAAVCAVVESRVRRRDADVPDARTTACGAARAAGGSGRECRAQGARRVSPPPPTLLWTAVWGPR